MQGDRVQTWLNGVEMVDITDAKIGAAQGRIALQIHDGGGIKVLWRNLRLRTLLPKEPAEGSACCAAKQAANQTTER